MDPEQILHYEGYLGMVMLLVNHGGPGLWTISRHLVLPLLLRNSIPLCGDYLQNFLERRLFEQPGVPKILDGRKYNRLQQLDHLLRTGPYPFGLPRNEVSP